MKKKFMGWLIGTAIIMLLLPWAAVTFAKSDAGMTVTLLLFFVIDPIYTVILGFFAGRNSKELWSLPVIAPILFLLGSWVFFDMGEGAFVIYAGVYLVIGLASLLVSSWFSGKSNGN